MTKYFTQDFMTLPRERRVEEMSTMLLRILYDADADTDANIAVVDRLLELRSTLVSEPYAAYVNFPWRTASATFKTLEEANAWIESHHDVAQGDYEYSWEITDRRTDSIVDSEIA
jgi:hypothetical protein